jgi:D-alanine-D-alanine ligase
MTAEPEIIVLCGGLSSESEVSLRSGKAVAEVLPGSRLVELSADALPAWLDPSRHIVFPVLHGGWGEDGRAQAEMEARGIAFAGCSSAANRLCMDKVATKQAMRAAGVPAIPEVAFAGAAKPTAAALVAALGEHLVIKPSDQGSSLRPVDGRAPSPRPRDVDRPAGRTSHGPRRDRPAHRGVRL